MKIAFDWNIIPDSEYEKYQKRVALVENLLDEHIDRCTKQKTIDEYCDHNGITKRTIRNYVKRYKKKGPKELLFYTPHPSSPRIKDRKLRKKIISMVQKNPVRSIAKILELLSLDDQFKDRISRISDRTIYRFLSENNMSQKERFRMLSNIGRKAYHQLFSERSRAGRDADNRRIEYCLLGVV